MTFEEDQPKILIVDDQSFNLDAIEIILTISVGLNAKAYC